MSQDTDLAGNLELCGTCLETRGADNKIDWFLFGRQKNNALLRLNL